MKSPHPSLANNREPAGSATGLESLLEPRVFMTLPGSRSSVAASSDCRRGLAAVAFDDGHVRPCALVVAIPSRSSERSAIGVHHSPRNPGGQRTREKQHTAGDI